MANDSPGRRKPRVRKPAPTVRETIENREKRVERRPRRPIRPLFSAFSKGLSPIGRLIKKILQPLSPVGRIILKVLGWLVPTYFVNSWRELRKVTWTGRGETWRLTGAVFVFAIIFGALVAVVDYGLDQVFRKLVLR